MVEDKTTYNRLSNVVGKTHTSVGNYLIQKLLE